MPTFNREPDGSLSPLTMKSIQEELYKLTDEYSIEAFPVDNRNHLGVSVIGEKCSRKLWYGFRWVKVEQFIPRMRRLFNRGHLEEEKFRALLTWMGFYVRDIDPLTNKQYRFSTHEGHYGGSGDSVALLPWFKDDESFRILVEYKTHNKKSFDKLKAEKLRIAKPQHFIQMSGYGKAFQIKYGLYCAINKDDDDLYFEFVELDWNLAYQMENKALDIIQAKFPPPRISDQPAYFECKWCHFNGICHSGEPVEINCRSCKYAVPALKGSWFCTRHNDTIPLDFIKRGCGDHVSINS